MNESLHEGETKNRRPPRGAFFRSHVCAFHPPDWPPARHPKNQGKKRKHLFQAANRHWQREMHGVHKCAHRDLVRCYSPRHVGSCLLVLVPFRTLPCATTLTVLLSFAFPLTLIACGQRVLSFLPHPLVEFSPRLRSSTPNAHRSLLVALVARLLSLSPLCRHAPHFRVQPPPLRLSVILRQVFAATTIRCALSSLLVAHPLAVCFCFRCCLIVSTVHCVLQVVQEECRGSRRALR